MVLGLYFVNKFIGDIINIGELYEGFFLLVVVIWVLFSMCGGFWVVI